MKLEYLAEGSPDCPLIRLYDFTPAEAAQFHAGLTQLSRGILDQILVHELPYVETIGACRLSLCVRTWDQSVVRGATRDEFECGFTPETWDNVAGLVEPFAQGYGEFQWLAVAPGEATLLLSVSGQW